jgi:hypothetical protein
LPDGTITWVQFVDGLYSFNKAHPNYWLLVAVGVRGFANTLADIYSSVFISPSMYARADTLEEAYAIIKERRAQRDASPDD